MTSLCPLLLAAAASAHTCGLEHRRLLTGQSGSGLVSPAGCRPRLDPILVTTCWFTNWCAQKNPDSVWLHRNLGHFSTQRWSFALHAPMTLCCHLVAKVVDRSLVQPVDVSRAPDVCYRITAVLRSRTAVQNCGPVLRSSTAVQCRAAVSTALAGAAVLCPSAEPFSG